LVAELRDLATFIHARETLDGEAEAKAKVTTSLINSFIAKLGRMKNFTSQSGLLLLQALQSTTLGADQQAQIRAAVDTRLLGEATGVHGRPAMYHVPQKLTQHITNYFTQAEWAILKGERTSVQGRMQVVVDRFVSTGLHYPHEQTIKWAIAVVALAIAEANGGIYPTYGSIFGMVQDLKHMIDSARRPWHWSYIIQYPEHPRDLPVEIFAAAYGDSAPVAQTWDRLATTAEHHVPLRKSSALLKADGKQPAASGNVQPMAFFDQLQMLFQNMCNSQVPLTLAGQQTPKKRPLALQDGPVSDGALIGLEPAGKKFAGISGPRRSQSSVESPGGSSQSSGGAAFADPRTQSAPQLALAGTTHEETSHGWPVLHLHQTSPSHVAVPAVPPVLQLHQTSPSHAAVPAGAEQAVPPATTAEEYEKAAFNKLGERPSKRKAAMKKPAAAPAEAAEAKVAKKKPSTADRDDDVAEAVVIPTWSTDHSKKPRRNFQSKAYHATEKKAEELGYTDSQTKLAAQVAYKRAGAAYDKKVGA